ncbi:dna polymerase delta small subunit [Nicotiana attenuata]|uniref:Dna polymerase delta small subunit n=1 Tax=Nicotiana attenuata TaxID=49451 RepID=A0A1J6JB13_NICAT|nr:dna polymerase delta small subunit [Nicotiana attenuata]
MYDSIEQCGNKTQPDIGVSPVMSNYNSSRKKRQHSLKQTNTKRNKDRKEKHWLRTPSSYLVNSESLLEDKSALASVTRDSWICTQGEDKYVVFISGLSVGKSSSSPLQFQLFVDHITGHLGDAKEQNIAAQIVQVVIAGNSVEVPHGLLNGQNLGSKDQSRLFEPIKELDILLTQIAASIPLDIMPGSSDPANFALPQQPLHRCLFPGSSAYNTFRSCTNPHCFELDNIRFVGTSGQNIDDLGKYSEANSSIEFMERTLRWRHLAPTAPNTLGCYPFTDKDPFYVETCPHVYFVGNQDKFETRLIKGSEGQMVRLICIPGFADTGMAVVLNIRNLECHTLSFATQIYS